MKFLVTYETVFEPAWEEKMHNKPYLLHHFLKNYNNRIFDLHDAINMFHNIRAHIDTVDKMYIIGRTNVRIRRQIGFDVLRINITYRLYEAAIELKRI